MAINNWTVFFIVTFIKFAKFDTHEDEDVVRYFDENNQLHLINLTVPDVISFLQPRLFIDARFWLYTKNNKNDYEELYIDLKNVTHYNPYNPLIIVTHGWLHCGHGSSTQLIKDAYLMNRDVNVIIVDWKDAAGYLNYLTSAYLTDAVGAKIRDMVLSLSVKYKISGKNIRLIGHSLGAHVVGLAGIKLKKKKFIVNRVTGLDPARPFFEFPRIYPSITKEAAKFVDIIHTNIGVLGYRSSIGHADFYPNGGIDQPHCCLNQVHLSCQHRCAYVYFHEEIEGKKDLATKCESYLSYLDGLCNNNDKQLMGISNETARGNYYLTIPF